MLKNYLKIALRNMIRHKGYSFINISGLAIGMACCILIFLWVQDELSFDRFHKNGGDIYRAGIHFDQGEGSLGTVSSSPGPMAAALKDEYPEILDTARSTFSIKMAMAHGDKIYNESLHFVDPSFLNILTFPLKQGSSKDALKNPHSIILTERMARKYFGSEPPLGKTLLLNNKHSVLVTGLMRDIPANSSITFDCLLPFKFYEELGGRADMWGSNDYQTYVRLRKNTHLAGINAKIRDRQSRENERYKSQVFLFPIVKMHLYSFSGENNQVQSVYIFSLIGFLILLIACINFMNLATARSAKRAQEVGLRKVFGVDRKRLMTQFFGESLVMVLISLLLAVLLTEIALPFFNNLAAKDLSLGILTGGTTFLGIVLIALITGLLAGSYPALVLSGFQPVEVIKRASFSDTRGSKFRKALVVFQFSLSVVLFIGTVIVYKQLGYMQSKSLGMQKENIVTIKANPGANSGYPSLKAELLKNPGVQKVTTSYTRPSEAGYFDTSWEWEGKAVDKKVIINKTWVSYDYPEVFGLQLIEGRFFSPDFPGEERGAVVINEKLAKVMGQGSPLGKIISRGEQRKKVVGVVKNYHYLPVQEGIGPLMLHFDVESFRYIFVRVSPDNIARTVDQIRETYRRVNPGAPFEFTFLDEEYDRYYRSEQRLGNILNAFTLLAILISCLGLFGLASFMAEQRTKEIGVRKVLGASVRSITILFSSEFSKWVILANLIAWPLAYFAMNQWLKGFAYRIDIGLGIFILAGAMTLLIALGTVSYQSIKAATSNPVEALRYE